MYEDKFRLKRSNSQTDFDLQVNTLMDGHVDYGLNQINPFTQHLAPHDELMVAEIPHIEKSFSVPAFVNGVSGFSMNLFN
jgi:hypothetical protein